MSNHIFYKAADQDCPAQICDRNGEVVLDLCKLCNQAESELAEICPNNQDQNSCNSYMWSGDCKNCAETEDALASRITDLGNRHVVPHGAKIADFLAMREDAQRSKINQLEVIIQHTSNEKLASYIRLKTLEEAAMYIESIKTPGGIVNQLIQSFADKIRELK